MNNLVLDSNAKVVNSPPCIYFLVGGQILFSEEAEQSAFGVTFDFDKTAYIEVQRIPVVDPQHPEAKPTSIEVTVRGNRLSASPIPPFMPNRRFVPWASITQIDNVTDPKTLDGLHQMISKIVRL